MFIADGDTIRVRLAGRIKTIRFTGLNAMELTRYSKYPSRRRGACHGLAATALVERAIKRSGWRVRLAAQKATSHSNKRLRRSVWVRQGGRWRDLAKLELQAGLALWLPNHIENAHNREYAVLAQRAAGARKGLYDPGACGAGPDQDLPVSVTVNWDADGNDAQNLDGEWIDVHNGGARDLPLGGWWVRDSWLRYGADHVPGYRLPDGDRRPGRRDAAPARRLRRVRRARAALVPEGVRVRERHRGLRDDGRRRLPVRPATATCARRRSTRAWSRAATRWPARCAWTCSRAATSRSPSPTRAARPGRPRRAPGQAPQLRGQAGPVRLRLPVPSRHRAAAGRDAADRPGRLAGRRHALERHLGRGPYVLADGKGVVSLRTTDDLVTSCDVMGHRVVPLSLRERLEAGPAIGLWAAIPSPLTAEAAGAGRPRLRGRRPAARRAGADHADGDAAGDRGRGQRAAGARRRATSRSRSARRSTSARRA